METPSHEYPKGSRLKKKGGGHGTGDLEELEQEGETEHDPLPLDCCLFLFLMMVVGHCCKGIQSYTGLPYTSLITAAGIAFGYTAVNADMGRLGEAIDAYSRFPPHLLLLVFLPALIFESAFNSDWHIFKVELW